jgi:uncharacterized membrane protein
MGKKAKARRESQGSKAILVEQPKLRESPNWILLALAVAGVLLTSYLSWTAFNGKSVRGCSVGSSCDIVLSSRWATLMGLPTATWGLLAYLTLAATAFVRRVERHWMIAWCIATFGLLYSLYLTSVSLTVLNAACPYCLTSLTLMTITFAVVTWQRPDGLVSFSWPRWLSRTVPVGLAAILLLHLNYSGILGEAPAAEDPAARALAEHLTASGAKFYGAFWCPHCQQQKAMFGRSASRLPYIECSPSGQSAPEAKECSDARINSYPTWFFNGQRVEEVLDFKQLAERSGFKEGQSASK